MQIEKRVLGLDVGEKRIGLAISDSERRIATPFTTILRRDGDDVIAKILQVVHEEGVERILVGMPLSLDGSIGPQAKITMTFYNALITATSLKVETWDERFSSAEAERLLREAGFSHRRLRDRLDAMAATVILQEYLDSKGSVNA